MFQIGHMRDIYRGAEETCIWLGEEADNSNFAMDLIAKLDGDSSENSVNKLSAMGLQAIAKLQERPWWTRVWVIQEALLSPHPIVRCGNKTLPIDCFIRLDDIRRGWHRPSGKYIYATNFGSQNRQIIRRNPFSAVLTDFDSDRQDLAPGRTFLREWAQVVDDFNATEPLDKMYALLGLASEEDRKEIEADYDKTVAKVYSRATALFITQAKVLIALQFNIDNKSSKHGLPSWVPDYSSEPLTSDPGWVRPPYVPFMYRYAATGNSWDWNFMNPPNPQSIFQNDYREFHIKGLYVDSIAYVSRNERLPSYMGLDASERIKNVKQRAEMVRQNVKLWEAEVLKTAAGPYGPRQSREEAFWRTLMADRSFDGAPAPAAPSNPCFDTWMDRASVPPEFIESHPGLPLEEVKDIYLKPFVNAVVTRVGCGRSFIITQKGYLGLAPFKAEVGDIVCLLAGGGVPFVLRDLEDVSGGGREDGDAARGRSCQLMGESYVHGIMNGEWVQQAEANDLKTFILK